MQPVIFNTFIATSTIDGDPNIANPPKNLLRVRGYHHQYHVIIFSTFYTHTFHSHYIVRSNKSYLDGPEAIQPKTNSRNIILHKYHNQVHNVSYYRPILQRNKYS